MGKIQATGRSRPMSPLVPARPSLSRVAALASPARARTVDGAAEPGSCKEGRAPDARARRERRKGGRMDPGNIFVGIDVAKDWLDGAQGPDKAARRGADPG